MHHLLVVAVLVMAVSMSAMVRSYPLEHGYELKNLICLVFNGLEENRYVFMSMSINIKIYVYK